MRSLRRKVSNFFRALQRLFLQFVNNHPIVSSISLLLTVIATTSMVFRLVERDSTDPIWRSVVYIFSGLDVDPPETATGQTAAVLVLLCGVIFASMLTGYIASAFSRLWLSSQSIPEKPVKQILEDHVIIFGWGPKTRAILRELNADYALNSFKVDDFVIVSDELRLEKGSEDIYRNVWHVRGSATETAVLRRADLTPENGAGATVAVIVSDSTLPEAEADRKSLLAILAVEHLYPEVVSLAEIQREANKQHFLNAYADEVLLPKEYGRMLLARTTEFPGIAAYVDQLLSLERVHEQEKNQRPQRPISVFIRSAGDLAVAGIALRDAVLKYYLRRSGIIIGIITEQDVHLFADPDVDIERELLAEDYLVLIATPGQI